MPAWTDDERSSAADSTSGTPERSWRRSTGCADKTECTGESNCVEVARLSPELIGLRDSARPEAVLRLSRKRFSALLQAISDRDEG
ncbi:DUF397 domain-containing protein [Actinomadura opuntiae]|uniref:DUF397 domain-containing protein n=1 Tax=Actinomadura sp. OS1-43 TaxID=604315 RepID=UPI00333F1A5A